MSFFNFINSIVLTSGEVILLCSDIFGLTSSQLTFMFAPSPSNTVTMSACFLQMPANLEI